MGAVKKTPCNVDNFSNLDDKCVQLFKSIHELHAVGYSNTQIAKLLRISRNNVPKYIYGEFEALCQKKLRSGMDVYHDYIVKSLKAGISRKDTYNSVVAMGFKGKLTSAYVYMNKLIDHYGMEISIYKSTSAAALQRKKDIQKYDYLTRADLFRSLWMNHEIAPAHKEFVFNQYPQLYELNI